MDRQAATRAFPAARPHYRSRASAGRRNSQQNDQRGQIINPQSARFHAGEYPQDYTWHFVDGFIVAFLAENSAKIASKILSRSAGSEAVVDSRYSLLRILFGNLFIKLHLNRNQIFTILSVISTVLVQRLLQFRPHTIAKTVSNLLFLCGLSSAGVAQLVEHLICNQRVGGSIPSASSTILGE